VRPTLLYINSETVIPAKAGIQLANTGFRVKPGMTIKVKGLLTEYIRFRTETHQMRFENGLRKIDLLKILNANT
jgi:hypothetical protein